MAVSGVEVIVQGQASATAEVIATNSATPTIVGQKGDRGPRQRSAARYRRLQGIHRQRASCQC